MAKNNNLTDFLTDIANTIRTKKGTTGNINPQNFSAEITSISGDVGGDYDIFVTNNSGGTQSLAITDAQSSSASKYFKTRINGGTNATSGINKAIKKLPDNITISGTRANYLFYNCSSITSIPFIDTSNIIEMPYMFTNCSSLTTIPLIDTSNVTSMIQIFAGCTSLTTIPLIDTSNITSTAQMFNDCTSLTTIPLIDTSNVTQTTQMFKNCTSLTTVPALNMSNVTNGLDSMLYGCPNLESILMYGMKANFNISASTKFTADALATILNNLATVTTTKTLTMGTTNLDKLTQAQKDIALNKGWTLA